MYFFVTTPCLVIKDAPLLSLVNDIDRSLTDTDDSILTHILLFGKASLVISAQLIPTY